VRRPAARRRLAVAHGAAVLRRMRAPGLEAALGIQLQRLGDLTVRAVVFHARARVRDLRRDVGTTPGAGGDGTGTGRRRVVHVTGPQGRRKRERQRQQEPRDRRVLQACRLSLCCLAVFGLVTLRTRTVSSEKAPAPMPEWTWLP